MDVLSGSEGSASDELHAARAQSGAAGEPAIRSGAVY
jgi:hypothetical protein